MKPYFVVLFLVVACLSCDQESKVESITLNPASIVLYVSDEVQLTVECNPSDAVIPAVSYSSDNPAVATVSETGIVTAVAVGECTITATAGGHTATCMVTVSAEISLYADPVLDFGATKSEVETAETRVFYETSSGTTSTGYEYLVYEGENDYTYWVVYYFIDDALVEVQVILDRLYSKIAGNMLDERYEYVGSDYDSSGYYYDIWMNDELLVWLSTDSDYVIVGYDENTDAQSSAKSSQRGTPFKFPTHIQNLK